MFTKPCHGPITSLYDMHRKHPKTGNVQPHWGIDYGNHEDNTIMAAAHGVVRAIVRNHETAGNYIVIKHPNGWETAYLHLSSISVSLHHSVTQGQKIGIKGATGKNVTGIHLHFEVAKGPWSGGSSLNVDPALYIDDPDVRTLQTSLNKLGYKLTVDGKYGESTKKAVVNYQKKNGLTTDGVAGRLTMAAVIKSAGKVVASTQPTKKEDEELEFSSATLKRTVEDLLNSPAKQKQLIEAGIKAGSFGAVWLNTFNQKKLGQHDIIGLYMLHHK